MNTFIKTGFFAVIISVYSCTSTPSGEHEKTEVSENEVSIARKWTLSDKLHSSNPATKVVLSLEKNGYFSIYDSITDPKFAKAGIDKIQSISKGQWKYDNNQLTLNHLSDSTHTEVFEVTTLNADKLEILSATKKKHTYLAH